MSLSARVLLGLGLGVVTGLFFGESVSFLEVPGRAFVVLLQMTVLPFVSVALIHSLGRLRTGRRPLAGAQRGRGPAGDLGLDACGGRGLSPRLPGAGRPRPSSAPAGRGGARLRSARALPAGEPLQGLRRWRGTGRGRLQRGRGAFADGLGAQAGPAREPRHSRGNAPAHRGVRGRSGALRRLRHCRPRRRDHAHRRAPGPPGLRRRLRRRGAGPRLLDPAGARHVPYALPLPRGRGPRASGAHHRLRDRERLRRAPDPRLPDQGASGHPGGCPGRAASSST